MQHSLRNLFKMWGYQGIMLAAFGAFLLVKNVLQVCFIN